MKLPTIKIIGVGGCGTKIVEHLARSDLKGTDFIGLDTNVDSLDKLECVQTLLIGEEITNGKGANGDAEKGKMAALEDKGKILKILNETDVLFLLAGMGGGTGTGASLLITGLAKKQIIYTSALIIKPMTVEGKTRVEVAEKGILSLRNQVDSIIELPNMMNLPYKSIKDIPMNDLFQIVNDMAVGIIRNMIVPITALFNEKDF